MFAEILSKKLTRKQRAGRADGPDRTSQAGGSHAPPGFAIVPNSLHGGYRKRHGESWVYWYPDSGVAGHGEDDHAATKQEAKPQEAAAPDNTASAKAAGEEAAKAGGSQDAVVAAMLGAVDTSNPAKVAASKEVLASFNMAIVGDDVEAANAIALLVAADLQKDVDFCKVAPPACAGNLGVPRHDMPQIIGDSLAELLKPGKEGDYPDKWKYDEIVKAGGDVSDHSLNMQDLFLKSLEADGIGVDRSGKPMKVGDLKATQQEIKAGKAASFAAYILADKFPNGDECTLAKSPIVVTSDGYILDGHHRYAAVRLIGANKTIPTVQIDMPMADLLKRSLDFPGVYRADIQDKPINDEASAKAVGAQWPKPDFDAYASAAGNKVKNYKKSLSPRDQLYAFAKAAAEPEPEPEAATSDAPKVWPKLPSERELDDMYEDYSEKIRGMIEAHSGDKPDVEKGLAPLRARLELRKAKPDCGCADKAKKDKCKGCADKAKARP